LNQGVKKCLDTGCLLHDLSLLGGQGDPQVDDGCQVGMDCCCCPLGQLLMLMVVALVVRSVRYLPTRCGGHWCDKSCAKEQRGPLAIDDHGDDCYWHLLTALHNLLWSNK